MNADILNRKGATSPKDVPADILALIERGKIPTVNLGESMAVDNFILLETILRDNGMLLDISELKNDPLNRKLMTCYRNIGRFLLKYPQTLDVFSYHESDIARCWACLAYGFRETDMETRLELIMPFADDIHMGVREMAWMALRDDISKDVKRAVELLLPWTKSPSAYIRRCASEATRPRGVWCAHIQELKDSPEKGLAILEPLRSDPHKYVQDSVANWLNDASKSRPEWVVEITDRWTKESPTKETAKICKRALRTINKK